MRNRVEITGINTSELKPMPNEESIKLIKESQNGDDDARDLVVYGNLLLVLILSISLISCINTMKEKKGSIYAS